MIDLKTQLTKLGLTPTESAVYLTGLKQSVIEVQELIKNTGIKRPTIYHALETLIEKGLVAKHATAGKTRYIMSHPRQLQALLAQSASRVAHQQQLADFLIPQLPTGDQESDKTVIAQYDGIEGVKFVIDTALYCKSKKWDIIAPVKNFFSDFDPKYARYYLETRAYRNITTRSLWEKAAARRALTRDEIKNRQPRILPPAMHGKFKSVVIIFDHHVAIIGSVTDTTAILITSKEVHETFAAMFEGLWVASEKYSA